MSRLTAHVAARMQAAELLRPGMVRNFTVIDIKEEDDSLVLSMAERERELQESRLRQMYEHDITVPGVVVSANLGGVLVDVLGMNTGFVPNSHLGSHEKVAPDASGMFSTAEPTSGPSKNELKEAGFSDDDFGMGSMGSGREDLIGTKMNLKFLELNFEEGKMMMSARRVDASETLTQFKTGDVVEGIVSKARRRYNQCLLVVGSA
jgi:ribosomal protein S1